MKTTVEKNDSEIKTDVLYELKYEPRVKTTDIGVLVKDGTVTLNGDATSFGEKLDAVNAAKRVRGVNAVADEIIVKLTNSYGKTDEDIAASAVSQIKWSTTIPAGSVQITVRDGWITLEGEVEWRYQYTAAQDVMQYLAGVKGVSNLITIKPKLAPEDISIAIKAALERNAQLKADNIQVDTLGSNVILRGTVGSCAEHEEAERVAWAAPGVYSVDNKLTYSWTNEYLE